MYLAVSVKNLSRTLGTTDTPALADSPAYEKPRLARPGPTLLGCSHAVSFVCGGASSNCLTVRSRNSTAELGNWGAAKPWTIIFLSRDSPSRSRNSLFENTPAENSSFSIVRGEVP